MKNFRRSENNKVRFVSLVNGLDEIEEVRPRPAMEFLPEWWKAVPKYADTRDKNTVTAKACPALPHYFGSGFIIPMWQDTTFYYDSKIDAWGVKAGREPITSWETHPKYQLLDHVDAKYQGNKATFTFKVNSPWLAFTPPGWSLLQLPLFYDYSSDYSVMPGLIDTDVHHEINQQLLYFGDAKEVTIKRGQPFAQYVPVKREKLELEVGTATEKDLKEAWVAGLHLRTKFPGTGEYKKLRTKTR